ncbi:Uncharacterised protein [Legionella beliardensis]|uniref:Uncharacterized protein n=1 Tax=Legionella beliardensis TaxID=91822 RepID=A0A378I1I9_9GAMM|nr:Uncharacterised protein [Legionella beliardensis]
MFFKISLVKLRALLTLLNYNNYSSNKEQTINLFIKLNQIDRFAKVLLDLSYSYLAIKKIYLLNE